MHASSNDPTLGFTPTPDGPTASHHQIGSDTQNRTSDGPPDPTERIAPGPLPEVPGYAIEGELGRGGMGVVYKARQNGLNRTVALKTVLAGAHAGADELVRFLAEAETAARLRHQGIVQVYESDRHAGLPYFTMEFVDGGSLADRLAGGPCPPAEAARIGLLLAEATAHAHTAGVVHRDLKPANILLTADGTPKITDFGLARRLGAGDGLTRTGSVLGTPAYMSPEQARGDLKAVGPAGDVYSLGAVLYELLTGRPPFRSDTALNTLALVLNAAPARPRAVSATIPRDLETICLKCLEKEPSKRYASAAALADDLRRFLDGRAILARRASAAEKAVRWAKRNPAVAGLLTAVFLSLTAGVVVSSAFASRAAENARAAGEKADLAETKTREAEEVSRRLGERAYSSDMRLMRSAFEEGRTGFFRDLLDAQRPGPGRPDLRGFEWRYWDRLSAPALRGRGAVALHSVAVSPDGARAVTGTDRGAVVWDLRTGRALRTFDGHTNVVFSLACGPGGLTLSGSGDGTAVLWDANDGTVLVRFAGVRGVARPVAFSPDGRRFAVGNRNEFTVYDTATRAPVATRTVEGPQLDLLVFSPDGTRVVTGGSEGAARLLEVSTGREVATFNVHRGRNSELRGLALSRDGTRLASSTTTSGVLVWEIGSKADPVPMTGIALPARLAFLSDGGLVGTTFDGMLYQWDAASGARVRSVPVHSSNCVPAATSDGRVVTASFDQTIAVWDFPAWHGRLTGHRSQVTAVAISPDGRRYASAGGVWDPTGAGRYAGGELKLWDAATGGILHDLVRDGSGVTSVAFSPDGRLLASGSGTWDATQQKYTGGVVSLWDAASGQPIGQLLGHGSSVLCLAFSPDGARLASGGFDGTTVVWDVAAGKTELTFPAHGGRGADGPPDIRAVTFSPDGRTLTTGGSYTGIRLRDLRTGTAREWPVDGVVAGLAYSPDGTRLAVVVYGTHLAVHDAATGEPRLALEGHNRSATAAVYSPDGSRIATVSEDQTVRVWLAKDGQEVLALKGHTDVVRSIAFTKDGNKLVTGGWDKIVRIWDATPLPGD